MNKKTTRLSSIALALMMVLMVALTLVPVGAAFAADESATIEIIDTSGDGELSANYLVKEDSASTGKIRIKVSEAIWKDDKSFTKVMMTLVRPDEKNLNRYANVEMTKSTTEDGVWYYDIEIKYLVAPTYLGLWSVKLVRQEGTWADTEPLELGAFWLYQDAATVIDADATKTTVDAAPGYTANFSASTAAGKPNYVKPGSKIALATEIKTTQPTNDGFLKYFDNKGNMLASVEIAATAAAADDYEYTIPSDAKDGDKYIFSVLFHEDGRSLGVCELAKFKNGAVGSETADVVVDAVAPELGDVYTSQELKIGRDVEGIYFYKIATTVGKQYVEISTLTDAKSGVVDYAVARFTSIYNKNVKYEFDLKDLPAVAAAGGNLIDGTKQTKALSADLSASIAALVASGGQWKLEAVATDKVGNESIKEYGIVKFYETYNEITSIRVEAQNVIEMYVGQTLTKEELLSRNVTVEANKLAGETAASYPDEWYWSVDASDSAYFDYDPVAGTVTAKKAGEGRLKAVPFNMYESETLAANMDATSQTGQYLRIKITSEPSVNTIKLNNSTMTLAVGASQKLTATVDPSGVTPTWETGNSAIATVDSEGNVTGVADGTAVIYAKAGAQVAYCTVTVKGDVVATGISLNKTAMSLTAGASETLFATTTPAGGAISWNTSDASVATVDNAGKVTAQKAGTATITATSGSYSATCVVTVTGTPETLEPNQWYTDDMGNIYYSNEHAQLTVGWKKIGGYWYLFDYSTAVMKKGWAKDAGTWYYLQSDGKMKTGWLKDGSTWYYLQASGAMKTGWLKDGGVWYYLKDSGAMATGWVKVSGIWYYLQGSGAMKEGWLLESGVWYYLTPSSGAMLANGTYTVEGRKSQFAASGRWLGYV